MLKNKLSNAFLELAPSPMLKMFQATAKYKNLINLGVGEPDLDSPPEVIEALKEAVDAGFTHYPPMNGYPDLRAEVCNYWGDFHGLKLTPDEVLITSGGIQAIYLVLTAFINPGDEVIVTDPCFPSYIGQARYVGGKLVGVPVYEKDGFVLTAEALKTHITPASKLLILNSPSNPTGAVIPRDEMEKIAKVVEKHDLMVLSDEIYESYVFEGEHVSFATLPGMAGRTITLGGFSKTYAMTGWRLGYLMGNVDIMRVLSVLSTDTVMGVPAMIQRAGVVALRDCRGFVKDAAALYKERVDAVAKLVNATPGMSCVKPKGSFYVFANIEKTGLSALDFAMKMIEEARVIVTPGTACGKNANNFVRISCNGTPEVLAEAFKRMTDALSGKPFVD
ncbi:MAG: pyridoxal phosphate-dependent aminotransferase [Oscillospiraceae bacterium]|nr:pyridoxal phosphate-dependent aminotransferase [Oscillospiraceae bacterium]